MLGGPPPALQALQKYCGFSMKLLFSPSSLLSVEDTGLLPRFMKCRDMARSSSWASTAEPAGGQGRGHHGEEDGSKGGGGCTAVPGAAEHPPAPAGPGGSQPDQTHLEAESIPGVN